jgi:serine-type D-Ala-D-Ala carboxypeptidase
MDFSKLESLVEDHLGKTFPAAQVEIRVAGEAVHSRAFGFLDPETRTRPTNETTQFDLASVSKLFTVTAFMTLVEQGHVALDQPLSHVLPEFVGERAVSAYPDPLSAEKRIQVVPGDHARVDAGTVTFRDLLAHDSGLPAWLPLWRMETLAERHAAVLHSDFAYPIHTRVVYSDIGLILLGLAIEKIAGQALDKIVCERVTAPLSLTSVGYGPIHGDNVAPTEFYGHQNRRMCGEVHDENAWALGGVAGHAGLFGTARDVAAFGEIYRRGGAQLLKRETVHAMTRLQAQDGAFRRGLGFALWSPDPSAASHPLSQKAFGHLGFAGTSLWIDPMRDLVVVCLTNRVYYGRNNADTLGAFRVALHRVVCEAVDG